jgi:UDP-GlcNAc:undecaprenyl-phosphate GlcNAc-1-phosphate transferase
MLKFATNLGIRNSGQPVMRWSNIAKPALGGITLYISFLISSTCFSIFFDEANLFKDLQTLGTLLSVAVGFMMGLADDAYNTKPIIKSLAQVSCGVILVATGTFIQFFENDYMNYILTVLWVMGIMNSINMLDNMDGITTIVSIFILLIALFYLAIHGDYHNFDFFAILGVLASLTAFLFHNWNPSKMFMGDTGSQFIGVFLAIISIKYMWNATSYIGGEPNPYQQVATVIMAFILPIIDTTCVVINRMSRKQSPFVGGKDHTTHHLSYLGLNDSRVGFVYLGISALSLITCFASFRYIEKWNWIHTSIFGFYFLFLFGIMFYITQQNKNKR